MALTKASLIDVNGQEIILDADADTSITADTDDQIDFKIGGSDLVTMNSSGNVIDVTGNIRSSGNFVGNNSSLASLSLEISGTETARVDNYNSAFRLINFHASTETILQGNGNITLNSVGSNSLILKTSNTERMLITSDGKVGIGTSSPSAELHVKKNDAGFEVDVDSQVTDGVRLLAFDRNTTTDRPMQYRASQHLFNASSSEAMRIDSSGRVLIGLTATQNAGSFSGRSGDALQVLGGEGINAKSTTNGGGCFVALGDSGNTAGSYFVSVNSSGSVDFRVAVGGALSKSSGSFKIEHPLESKKDTHNLVHSFIEGPQADLIYRGVAVLENGTASINLDTAAGMTEGTFVLLNTNTSCFTSNESDWDAVKGSVSGNTLTISCQNTSSTATVSWLVIGERHDQHMKDTDWTDNNGKVIVEPLKEQPYQ